MSRKRTGRARRDWMRATERALEASYSRAVLRCLVWGAHPQWFECHRAEDPNHPALRRQPMDELISQWKSLFEGFVRVGEPEPSASPGYFFQWMDRPS